MIFVTFMAYGPLLRNAQTPVKNYIYDECPKLNPMITYEWGVGQTVDHRNLTQTRIMKDVYTNLVNKTSNMTRNHLKDFSMKKTFHTDLETLHLVHLGALHS